MSKRKQFAVTSLIKLADLRISLLVYIYSQNPFLYALISLVICYAIPIMVNLKKIL